jgi:hypothetical protein
MASSTTTTITLRVSHQLLARLDYDAKRHGQDRNTYILSWLPYDDARCDTPHVDGGNGHRGFSSEPSFTRRV